MNEVMDPEEVADLMERIEQEATRVVFEHGGIVNQFVGDEVVALFGVPTAHEDDARRAAASAVVLHAFVRELDAARKADLGQSLRLHTGIHTGLLLAELRDPRHGIYSLRGDTINVAARLRTLARPDEILISESTHRLIAPYYLSEPLESVPLRGRTAPVTVYRLAGSTGAETAFHVEQRRGLMPLVGRVPELELLANAFAQVIAGRGQIVAIEGQSGVGKSRLLHEFRLRVGARATVLTLRCEAYGKVTPYQAFMRPLRQALGLLDPSETDRDALIEGAQALDLGDHLPAFMALLGIEPDVQAPRIVGEQLREVILRALVAVFLKLARHGPLVLLFEDWHWADEGSSTAAAHLAEVLGDHSILMIVSHRLTDTSRWGLSQASSVTLTPLTADETRQLTEMLLGHEGWPAKLAAAVHEHTGGNAFFVEQVCRALLDSRPTWKHGTGGPVTQGKDLPVPDTVQAVLRARIDALDPRDANILRLASVLGSGFPFWQLQILLEASEQPAEMVAGCMSRLAAVDLLHIDGEEGYRFKHAITQEVAYETLLRQRRRELHTRVARGIERVAGDNTDDFCEVIAHHYMAGEEHERAAVFAERAGDKAVRTFSLEEARQQYRRVIASLDRLDETEAITRRRIEAGLKWAAACMFNPSREQLDVLGRSLEHARRLGHQAGVAYTLCWLGCIEYALGDQERAAVTFSECVALASELGDQRLLAQLQINLGQSYAMATDYEKALQKLNDGLTRKEGLERRPSPRSGPRAVPAGSGRAFAVGYLGLIHGDLGNFREAHRRLDEALAIVRASHSTAVEGSVLTQLALILLWQGEWAAARATAAKMQRLAEQVHGPYILAMSKTVMGYADVMMGDQTAAIELLRSAVTWLEATQIGLTLSWNHACLAEGLALSNQFGEARTHALRALERLEARDMLGEVAAHRALGLADAGEGGSWSAARACFELALAAAGRKGSPRDTAITLFRGASVALRFGERKVATDWLTSAIDYFSSVEMSWYLGEAKALLAPLAAGPTGSPFDS